MTESPERVTISIPPDADLDRDDLDALKEQGDYESLSEAIREAVKRDIEVEPPEESDS